MTRSTRSICRSCTAAAALLVTLHAAATTRSACTPRPASDDVVSQSADALSMRLDTGRPTALVNWDVRWWQRHRVWITLDAVNAGDVAADVLPQMVVDARVDGRSGSFQFGRPMRLAPHAHALQRLSIYVPDDARTLGVRTAGVALAGAGAVSVSVSVSVSLECSDSRFDPGEAAPAASALRDEALKLYFDGYIDPVLDLRLAFETALKLSSGAQDSADVVESLRGFMQTLGDDHGFVLAAGEPLPARRALAVRAPEFDLRRDEVAVVRLHGIGAATGAAALAWAGALHDGVAALAARHPRAWIIDLRDADGDDPWPAFAALSGLLDGPAVGAFVSRQGAQPWIADRGVARVAGGPAIVDLQTPPEPTFRGPVAVLIGPNTRDAGEDVTVAFHGRAHTRFFGTDTAGFPFLGVRVHRLSDGTTLGILETRDADRAGIVQRLPMEPDAVLSTDAALDSLPQAAIDWVLEERSNSAGSR